MILKKNGSSGLPSLACKMLQNAKMPSDEEKENKKCRS